jgi:hypothetical protein
MVIYPAAISLAFVQSWMAYASYIMVAVMWLVPDPLIENKIKSKRFAFGSAQRTN